MHLGRGRVRDEAPRRRRHRHRGPRGLPPAWGAPAPRGGARRRNLGLPGGREGPGRGRQGGGGGGRPPLHVVPLPPPGSAAPARGGALGEGGLPGLPGPVLHLLPTIPTATAAATAAATQRRVRALPMGGALLGRLDVPLPPTVPLPRTVRGRLAASVPTKAAPAWPGAP